MAGPSPPDGKAEFTGSPAIIIQRAGDYKPGEWVAEKNGIFIRTFDDLADAYGSRIDMKLHWFDAARDLGARTFYNVAEAVANDQEDSRGGLRLNPLRYEAELFEKLKTGEALDKKVIAPVPVVKAIYDLRNAGEYQRRAEDNVSGKLVTVASGSDFAHRQWSCTPRRNSPDALVVVDFTDDRYDVYCRYRDGSRLSGRACFAELAP